MGSIKSTGKAIDISVVVPCYNEQGALPFYYDKMKEVMALLPELSFEVIIVDDGSTDGTLETAKQLAKSDDRIRYISFSRNFGKEAAMYAGLKNASGKYTAIMDADLQDPPEMLPEMYRVITEEGYDAVGTRRVTRKGEPPVRSFFARKFYKIMSRISKANMVDGARCRGTPRIANRLLKRVRDFAQVENKEYIDYDIAKRALDRLEIDEIGLG